MNPPPVQPPASHLKIIFLIFVIIVLSVVLTTLFFLKIYSLPQPTPPPTSTPIPTIEITPTPNPTIFITPSTLPTQTPIVSQDSNCDVPDNSLCRVISDLKTALSNKDYNGFFNYQNIQSVTCDPDGMYVTICDNQAKGVVKQGYQIGYNQSEGTTVTKPDYLQTISAYANNNSPLNYQGAVFQNDKAAVVFLNPSKDHVLLFPLKRTGTSWTMDFVLIGSTFNDNTFANLNNSLLNFVQ